MTTWPTDEMRRALCDEGYFVLEGALPHETLELLRDECDRGASALEEAMGRAGVAVQDMNHRGRRYFVPMRHEVNPAIGELLTSPLITSICRTAVGDEAYLLWEHFAIKPPREGLPFAWHQDSGYLEFAHRPYVALWCPLDDATAENGTLHVLPFSRHAVRERVEHTRDPRTNDLVGYTGDDPGDALVLPAGSVVVFSSLLLHRTSANTTDRARRAYLVEVSPEPLKTVRGPAKPLLRDGLPVSRALSIRPRLGVDARWDVDPTRGGLLVRAGDASVVLRSPASGADEVARWFEALADRLDGTWTLDALVGAAGEDGPLVRRVVDRLLRAGVAAHAGSTPA